MRAPFSTFLLLFWAATSLGQEPNLCELVMAHLQIDTPSKVKGLNDLRVADAVGTVLSSQAEARSALDMMYFSDETEAVASLMVPQRTGTTYHSIKTEDDFEGFVLDDTVMALRMPREEENLWQHMTEGQRETLVNVTAAKIQQARYPEDPDDQDHWLEAQTSLVIETQKMWALSPSLLVGSIVHDSHNAGVCRHANCAFAGVMGELGASRKDIRVASGIPHAGARVGHLWAERKRGEKWEEFDVTPTRRSTDMIDRMWTSMFGVNDTAIRTRFYKTWEHDFLKPLPRKLIEVYVGSFSPPDFE